MASSPETIIALGYQARRGGRLEYAKQLFAEAVDFCRGAGDPAVLARSLTGLAQIERDLKNNSQALQNYREAAGIYRSLPDPQRLAHTIRHVADILRSEGSIEQGRSCYEEALEIYREHSGTSPLDLANAVRGFALLRAAAGETEEAKALWQEAGKLYDAANVQPGVQESTAQIERLSGK